MNYFVQRVLALFVFILSLPLFFIVLIAIKLEGKKPLLFRQKRWGKDENPFTLVKFRTMVEGAEDKKRQIAHLNEADGPVFKIKDDPRYTKVGKFLAHTGIDELPQLLNIIRGEMTFIGPRPLPVEEAKKVPKKYQERSKVLPGITSLWVVEGAHKLTFDEWMDLDLEYIREKGFFLDIKIAVLTVFLMIKSFFKKLIQGL